MTTHVLALPDVLTENRREEKRIDFAEIQLKLLCQKLRFTNKLFGTAWFFET